MEKYRGTYRVYRELDTNGQLTSNEHSTYLKCKFGVEIFRYNSNTLAIMFVSNGYRNNRLKELYDIGVNLTALQSGDGESVYLFAEHDIHKVANILKPITRGANKSPTSCAKRKKRKLTEEQKEILRERLAKARLAKDVYVLKT